MKLYSVCFQCGVAGKEVPVWGEYRDEGALELACPNGHATRMALQDNRFELLFDLGLLALLDGHEREAFVTFAAALDRFVEFYLRVVAHERKVPAEAIDAALRRDLHGTERAIGAFAFTYLLENGVRCEAYARYANAWARERSEVIQGGRYPTHARTVELGTATLALIFELGTELKARHPDGCARALRAHVKQAQEPAAGAGSAGGPSPLGTLWPTTISWSADATRFGTVTFADALEQMRAMRARWWKP